MIANVWTSFCESGACVQVKWQTGCEGGHCVEVGMACDSGSCVEVGFATPCESGNCVEVGHDDQGILIRDSKLGEDSRVLRYTPGGWKVLCGRVKGGEDIDWRVEFHPLVFDADEIAAFLEGVRTGKFDPVAV